MAVNIKREREREMFYLTTHLTHFIYGYMASDIWLRTNLIVRKETRCRHIGYSYRLTARVLLYAPSHRQDNTYHSLCYTSHGALAGTRNSSMGQPHEGSIWWPITPWANALPLSYVPLLLMSAKNCCCLPWTCSPTRCYCCPSGTWSEGTVHWTQSVSATLECPLSGQASSSYLWYQWTQGNHTCNTQTTGSVTITTIFIGEIG